MTIEEFAEITFRVIAQGGLDDHIPTAVYPERDHIMALEEIPEDVDIETVSRRWAQENARGNEEYLVVFRTAAGLVKVVRHFGGRFEEGVFPVPDA